MEIQLNLQVGILSAKSYGVNKDALLTLLQRSVYKWGSPSEVKLSCNRCEEMNQTELYRSTQQDIGTFNFSAVIEVQ